MIVDVMSEVVSNDSIVAKGSAKAERVSGHFASASYAYNGRCFTQGAAGVMTATSTDSALIMPVFADFKMRTSSTFGEVDVDAVYSTTEDLEFLIPDNEIEWWAVCVELSSALYGGTLLQAGTLGALAKWDATSEKAVCMIAPGYTYGASDLVVRVRGI